ncbi:MULTISPECIES: hypothetical protein [Kocuria]|jgi:hypothetical protein|uniref:hypothetical protein n=1 Tax=Kocuria TaxID=57493 RepID=UPI00203FA6F6|nr:MULTISPECIES: hypothetical protein [Kocuria]MCM3688209.1 hypothetical protein [Kocuria rosea]
MSRKTRGLLAVQAATLLVLGTREVAVGGVLGGAVVVGAAPIALGLIHDSSDQWGGRR